jgi:hypothetical protein
VPTSARDAFASMLGDDPDAVDAGRSDAAEVPEKPQAGDRSGAAPSAAKRDGEVRERQAQPDRLAVDLGEQHVLGCGDRLGVAVDLAHQVDGYGLVLPLVDEGRSQQVGDEAHSRVPAALIERANPAASLAQRPIGRLAPLVGVQIDAVCPGRPSRLVAGAVEQLGGLRGIPAKRRRWVLVVAGRPQEVLDHHVRVRRPDAIDAALGEPRLGGRDQLEARVLAAGAEDQISDEPGGESALSLLPSRLNGGHAASDGRLGVTGHQQHPVGVGVHERATAESALDVAVGLRDKPRLGPVRRALQPRRATHRAPVGPFDD